MPRAFIIRPFGKKQDSSGKEIDFDRVDREMISPALEAAELGGGTTGEIVDAGNIREDMFALILEADLVIADITIHNANVFYELGIRHALRKKRTLMVKGDGTADGTPFDLLTDRYLPYRVEAPGETKDELIRMIKASMMSDRVTDSPIFQMLPSLVESDPSRVQVVPLDFREEVERARAAKAKGWLRLLSEEVRRKRYYMEALELTAKAQWDIKDFAGAKVTWEEIRETYPDNVTSNLALANIFERLYREDKERSQLLEASEHAIGRVLANRSTSRKERAEALGLKGRNQKTRWRLKFEALPQPDERRSAAMNRALIESYEAYREAFYEDLNHFYPGVAALQMGTTLLHLSDEDVWMEAFDKDRDAENYKVDLEDEVVALKAIVARSVDNALSKMDTGDSDRIWAKISEADALFLTDSKRHGRVISAYKHAIPEDSPFAWDAARGQLQLFASLGVNVDLAREIVEEIDNKFAEIKPKNSTKPAHLILFAGHRVDAPDRPVPRFPAASEQRAQELIRESVESIRDDEYDLFALASAAPGADIIAHEIFDEIGIPSTICLPIPSEAFARLEFENLDKWRTRFLNLLNTHDTLVLSDREGLPRWLQDSGIDPWERGNEWVMKLAQTWGAERITLISLWDGKSRGDAPGGTAQMVKLAEDTGSVYLTKIDSNQLLSINA